MTLTDLMTGLRDGYAKRTKYMGITLTRAEIGPILAEYDQMTTLKTHNVATRAEAEEYLRAQGFRPIKATVWIHHNSTAFIAQQNDEVITIGIRSKV